jgi:hypothetical protein
MLQLTDVSLYAADGAEDFKMKVIRNEILLVYLMGGESHVFKVFSFSNSKFH